MVSEPDWMDDDGLSTLWQAGTGVVADAVLGRDCLWFVKIHRAGTAMLLHEGPGGMYETPAGIEGWANLSVTQKKEAGFASKQDAKRAAETRLGICRAAPVRRAEDTPERHPDDPFCEMPSPEDDAGLCKPASEGGIDRRVYLVLRHAYCAEGPRFSLYDDGATPPADGAECAGWGSPLVPLYAAPLCRGDTLNPDPNCTDWGNPWKGNLYDLVWWHEREQFVFCEQEILWYPRPHACPTAEDCVGSADLGG